MVVMRAPPFKRPLPLVWPPLAYFHEALRPMPPGHLRRRDQNHCAGKVEEDGT